MRLLRAALLVGFLAAGTVPAMAACPVADPPPSDGLRFFLGLHPSDGPLEAWCRMQRLQGEFVFNVWFKDTGAHRSTEVVFDGRGGYPRETLLDYMQSLIPTANGPAFDAKGQPFSKVLARAMQTGAPYTPDKIEVALPDLWPHADELLLWEHLALRLRPVPLSGADFALIVSFKPNLGRHVLQRQGSEPSLTLRGWKGRLDTGSRFGNSCSALVPRCAELPEVVDVHGAWVLDEVRLEAEGGNLSGTAEAVLAHLERSYAGSVKHSNLRAFDPVRGNAKVEIRSGATEILAEAVGARRGDGIGTRRITVIYRQRDRVATSYAETLDRFFADFREALIRQAAAARAAGKPDARRQM